MTYLAECGYVLADVQDIHRWRSLPLPAHSFRKRHPASYSRGVIAQCDLVFLKDLSLLKASDSAAFVATAATLGYFDLAEAAAEKFQNVGVLAGMDVTAALRESSRLYGREASRQALWRALRDMPALLKSCLIDYLTQSCLSPA